jgi:hypothetical protein
MQEDIFERLHYHSGLVAQGCWDELDDYDREAIRRFGDLVVEECCRALHPMLRDQISRGQGVDLIKKHFGVEE